MPVSGHWDLGVHVAFSSVLQICRLGSDSCTCILDVNLGFHKQLYRVTFPSSSLWYLGIFQFPRAPSFCPLAHDWGFIYLSPLPISHHCTHIWGQVGGKRKRRMRQGFSLTLLGPQHFLLEGRVSFKALGTCSPLLLLSLPGELSCSLGLNKRACPGALSVCALMCLPQVQTGKYWKGKGRKLANCSLLLQIMVFSNLLVAT